MLFNLYSFTKHRFKNIIKYSDLSLHLYWYSYKIKPNVDRKLFIFRICYRIDKYREHNIIRSTDDNSAESIIFSLSDMYIEGSSTIAKVSMCFPVSRSDSGCKSFRLFYFVRLSFCPIHSPFHNFLPFSYVFVRQGIMKRVLVKSFFFCLPCYY